MEAAHHGPDEWAFDPLDPSQPGWEVHLQAQLDWLMSDDDPWAELEEEPPCFCTARLRHHNLPALQAQLIQAFPELEAGPPQASSGEVLLRWPKESYQWASWLETPPSFRGAGEIHLAGDSVEIWTPTRSLMRKVLRLLLDLPEADVELQELMVEDPFETLPIPAGEGEDLNPELDPDAFDFLLSRDEPDDGDEPDDEAEKESGGGGGF
ncbi:hypothetical protein [Limnochorda sp.]|uniref:hypothetical protein n=1 Tax=Limnochorda sp. TaxID=1940279 RepID=UPI0017D39587|nr:hypothetical protein [Bacillota bacterium]MBO2518754.1 hypothetical protein [Bacillota bacterium]NMA70420.1 hypothetical protein [Bacillota bacterium]